MAVATNLAPLDTAPPPASATSRLPIAKKLPGDPSGTGAQPLIGDPTKAAPILPMGGGGGPAGGNEVIGVAGPIGGGGFGDPGGKGWSPLGGNPKQFGGTVAE